MEWECESSDIVVMEMRSIDRLFRPLKAEDWLKRIEWIVLGKILYTYIFKNGEHVDIFLEK